MHPTANPGIVMRSDRCCPRDADPSPRDSDHFRPPIRLIPHSDFITRPRDLVPSLHPVSLSPLPRPRDLDPLSARPRSPDSRPVLLLPRPREVDPSPRELDPLSARVQARPFRTPLSSSASPDRSLAPSASPDPPHCEYYQIDTPRSAPPASSEPDRVGTPRSTPSEPDLVVNPPPVDAITQTIAAPSLVVAASQTDLDGLEARSPIKVCEIAESSTQTYDDMQQLVWDLTARNHEQTRRISQLEMQIRELLKIPDPPGPVKPAPSAAPARWPSETPSDASEFARVRPQDSRIGPSRSPARSSAPVPSTRKVPRRTDMRDTSSRPSPTSQRFEAKRDLRPRDQWGPGADGEQRMGKSNLFQFSAHYRDWKRVRTPKETKRLREYDRVVEGRRQPKH